MRKILIVILLCSCSSIDNLDLPMMPPERKLNHSILPPEEEPEPPEPPQFYGEPVPSINNTISFVLDKSCSMSVGNNWVADDGTIAYGTRLDRARHEMKKCILTLPKTFKFNVFVYDCTIRRWSPKLKEANAENKASCSAWCDANIWVGGGTGTGPAVMLSLEDKETKAVVLLTDGAPGCGSFGIQGHRTMINNANTQRAKIDVFGIGVTHLSFKQFCKDVASDSGGSFIDMN